MNQNSACQARYAVAEHSDGMTNGQSACTAVFRTTAVPQYVPAAAKAPLASDQATRVVARTGSV
jgi:hypothetical protein